MKLDHHRGLVSFEWSELMIYLIHNKIDIDYNLIVLLQKFLNMDFEIHLVHLPTTNL